MFQVSKSPGKDFFENSVPCFSKITWNFFSIDASFDPISIAEEFAFSSCSTLLLHWKLMMQIMNGQKMQMVEFFSMFKQMFN